MAEMEVKPCSNPGCGHPGTSSCSACKTTFYCCVICQTADWPHHKEECQGHLRKLGMAHLAKAKAFQQERNWVQALRYGELAATKLKQLKDRHLETVEAIDAAMTYKFNALNFMGRNREAHECIKECYTLWAMNHMRHPGSIKAAFGLIQSCLHNGENEDAEHYARHAMFMIAEMTDNFIPSDERPQFLADGSYWLARAILHWARAGGIPPEEEQKAGEEAIASTRQALEIHTQLRGAESIYVGNDMRTLAEALDHFNDVEDDEIFRLYQQSNAITSRVEGSSSPNMAAGEAHLGNAYAKRARRAHAANNLDRCMTNMEMALPHFREAERIYRANNRVESADDILRKVARVEGNMQQVEIAKAEIAAAAAAADTWG